MGAILGVSVSDSGHLPRAATDAREVSNPRVVSYKPTCSSCCHGAIVSQTMISFDCDVDYLRETF